MGPWFDETFRLDEVTEVVPSSFPWYGGLGVKLGPGDAVSVVAAQDRIALVRFRRPRTMHVLVAVQRSGLRLSVDDVDGLRAALTSRS